MTRRNKATSIEVLPRHDPDVAKLVAQTVQQKIAEAFSSDDLFRPFFETRKVAYEIKAQQTVHEQNKFVYYFEDYGCAMCHSKTAAHRSLAMCLRCYQRFAHGLKTALARRAPAPGTEVPTFMDTVKLAREALRPALAALAAENEVELAVPNSPRLRTQGEAVKEAGISRWTLLRWIKEGKVERPKERMSEKLWLWGDEDIERLRGLKVTNTPGRPKTLNIDAAQAAQLRAEGKSLTEIGQILGCSRETARRAFKEVKSK